MLLHDRFDYYARARGHLPCAQHGDRVVTYAEARSLANRLAHALIGTDLRPGDRVAFVGGNSIEAALLYFACSKAGVVPVPANSRLTPDEITFIARDAGARLLLADPELCPALAAAVSIADLLERADWPDHDPSVRVDPDDVLYQMYTSGTTGHPKGVLLTHRQVLTNCAQVSCGLSYTIEPGDRWLIVAPLFHAAAVITAFNCVLGGGTMVIQRGFDPTAVVDALSGDGIALTTLVPAMIQACLVAVPDASERDYPALRAIAYGGSVIAETTLRQAMDVFGCDFYQGFGQTESSAGLTYLTELDHRSALDGRPELLLSCGQPLPGTDIRIVDGTGADVAPGEVGEIVARGPQVMLGYWNRPDETAAALRDGWLFTGDAGSLDADGYLTIRDRVRDMVVTGGENVYPAEVENALLAHPAVAEAAVIGIPHDTWGEAVHAVVVLRDGMPVEGDELRTHCAQRLATFKVPQSCEIVAELPRNASGKVRKDVLRAPHWSGRARGVA
jgi:acyl-CoA synthetase (AMP-forming)/AMP-acid ligase II